MTDTGTGDLVKRLREPPSGGNEHYGSDAYRRKVLAPAADALEAAERVIEDAITDIRKLHDGRARLKLENWLARHATGQEGESNDG